MEIVDLQERNWQYLCTYHLQDWQGICTKYSPQGEMFEYFESLRSFRGNQEQTQVIQNNEYKYPDGRIDKKTWQINKHSDSLSDGVSHSANPSMRALFFDGGAAGWVMKRLETGKALAIELLFWSENLRHSVTTHYDISGNLTRTVCIREDSTGSGSKHWLTELNLLPKRDLSGNWQGTSIVMTPDLQISTPVATQLQFPLASNTSFFFPSGVSVSCPVSVNVGSSFTIAVNRFVSESQLQQLTVNYDEFGAFSTLTQELFWLSDVN